VNPLLRKEAKTITRNYRQKVENKINQTNLLNPQQKSQMIEKLKTKDVDHIVDLQLGGTNKITNLQMLDIKVNRSFGSQISKQIKEDGVPIVEIIKKTNN
jgi:5-methylcytosine-specific restriction endonuclease McrA